MRQFFLISASILCFTWSINCQTTTWTGATSVFWGDPTNWTFGTPDFTKDVIIGSGGVVEIVGLAQARSISIVGHLNVQATADLDVFGSSMNGIRNSGVLTNSGSIVVRGVAQDALINGPMGVIKQNAGAQLMMGDSTLVVLDNGIENHGLFENQLGASIELNHLDEIALNNVSGSFINYGSLTIRNIDAEGICNKANFTNNGNLLLANIYHAAIKNAALFLNYSELNISDVNGVGVLNGIDSSGILLDGTFNHISGNVFVKQTSSHALWNRSGQVYVDAAFSTESQIGGNGIINQGQFINDTNAQLNLHRINFNAVLNLDSLINFGCINIDTIALAAIVNGDASVSYAFWKNAESAVLKIDSVTESGILNTHGDFLNDGQVSIKNRVADIGINNSSFFLNLENGVINIDSLQYDGIQNLKSFANRGTITILNVDSNAIVNGAEDGTMSVVFLNQNGNISIVNAGNHGVKNIDATFLNSTDLIIENTGNGHGVLNEGTFQNEADGNVGIIGTSKHGFYNLGQLINRASIDIIQSGVNGLENGELDSTAELLNEEGGELIVRQSEDFGIRNVFGLIENLNFIQVDGNTLGNAVLNQDSFVNGEEAFLEILNSQNRAFFNTAYLQNNGKIQIDEGVGFGLVNGQLPNTGQLINHGGQIEITNMSADGFLNLAGKVVNSDSILVHDITGDYAFRNHDEFINEASGVVQSGRTGQHGIFNGGNTHFLNRGLIQTVDTIPNRAIYCGGNIHNETDGRILINSRCYKGLYQFNDTIYNKGLIEVNGDVSLYALDTRAVINNLPGAKLLIKQCRSMGWFSIYPSARVYNHGRINIGPNVDGIALRFTQEAQFQNFDSLFVTHTESGIGFGQDSSGLINRASGVIHIDSTDNVGFFLFSNGFFDNFGELMINNVSGNIGTGVGLSVSTGADLRNFPFSKTSITGTHSYCLRILHPGTTLENFGEIYGAIGPSGDGLLIDDSAILENAVDAIFTFE